MISEDYTYNIVGEGNEFDLAGIVSTLQQRQGAGEDIALLNVETSVGGDSQAIVDGLEFLQNHSSL